MEDDLRAKILEEKSKSLLSSLKASSPQPSPFLKTRLLAHLEEKQKRNSFFGWLPVLSTSSGLFTVILILWFSFFSSVGLQGVEGEELLLRYEDQILKNAESVDVVLPEGVKFHSPKYPQLKNVRVLKVSGERVRRLGYLPVVIRASESGKKSIRLILRDQSGQIMKEKKIPIHFQHKKSRAALLKVTG